jgi:alanine racemase
MKKSFDRKGLRTWITVDKEKLAFNVGEVRKLLDNNTKLMSVIKSNAYGHGLLDFAQAISRYEVDWLGVDSIVEAIALRNAKVKKPILVLGYTLPEMLEHASDLEVSIAVSTFELLKEIVKSNFSKKIKIHIKVDTGMHRQGFMLSQKEEVLTFLKKYHDKHFIVEGLFTHFASAKNPAVGESTNKQIQQFGIWKEAFKELGFHPITHASASSGTIVYPNARFDMVRVGVSLMGLWPSKEVEAYMDKKMQLKQALEWCTLVSEVKTVEAGERVGYDFTEILTRETKIAVCPIGYWHGFPRALSGIGQVLINGARAKVLGRVSMDMITIDVTDVPDVAVGDIVTIIGQSEGEIIKAEDIASLVDTSAYEIVTRINPLIKRIFV